MDSTSAPRRPGARGVPECVYITPGAPRDHQGLSGTGRRRPTGAVSGERSRVQTRIWTVFDRGRGEGGRLAARRRPGSLLPAREGRRNAAPIPDESECPHLPPVSNGVPAPRIQGVLREYFRDAIGLERRLRRACDGSRRLPAPAFRRQQGPPAGAGHLLDPRMETGVRRGAARGSPRRTPVYNSLIAFDVLASPAHLVLPIQPGTAGSTRRLSIGGWYHKLGGGRRTRMTKAGAISVIMSTRNRARYLPDALSTPAAQQCDGPFEVIVIDNGSSDGTPAIVEAWCRSHPRFRTEIGRAHV